MTHLRACIAGRGGVLLRLAALLALLPPVHGQYTVSPVFKTPSVVGANVDSCVTWIPDVAGEPLLFVTEKDGDRIEVWRADDGTAYAPRPWLGGVIDGSGPGELNRPNGVWVLYHVRYADGFTDALLVTDQQNQRVQVFRLPELTYFGEFGTGEVGKGYGLASYQDGTDQFVFVTDNIPPASSPGKIKKYRILPGPDGIGAELVLAVGSSTGNPPLPNVESIVCDLALDRLHVCGDEGGKMNRVFRLDGTYTGISYGDPQFEYDQEGINLYDTGAGKGYLLVSDQYTNGQPNQFEIFERDSLGSLGNFTSPADGAIVTRNTDGAYLEQRGFGRFPNGAFFAVDDDHDVHAYDWTDIAESVGLEIVAPDLPFRSSGERGKRAARRAVWFHDGSWWALLPRDGSLVISRLEDGTFRPQAQVGAFAEVSIQASGPSLAVLSLVTSEAMLSRFEYRPSLRRYLPAGEPEVLGAVRGVLADLVLEDPGSGWVAWVDGGDLLVERGDGGLSAWPATGIRMGAAEAVVPRCVRLEGAVGVLWVGDGAVRFRTHADGDAPDVWSPVEVVAPRLPSSLGAVAAPGGGVVTCGAEASGSGFVWMRGDAGWAETVLEGDVRDPAIIADGERGRFHLFHMTERNGHSTLWRREAGQDLSFGAASFLAGWPGVGIDGVLVPGDLPVDAPDIVAVGLGDDGRGYFGRVALPSGSDRLPPITSGHSPPPGSTGVPEGSEVSFRLTDGGTGVDRSSLKLLVDGDLVSPLLRGVPRNLLVSWRLPPGSGPDVMVRIEASDLATPPNGMTPFEYSFQVGVAQGPGFHRGDANGDGAVDVSDAVRILVHLFAGAPGPSCEDAADSNDDGSVGVGDAVYLLDYLFLAGTAPPPPGQDCGVDPTPDALTCEGADPCT